MSQNSSSSPTISTQGASFVTASVNHQGLLRTDSESVRVVFRLYNQHSNKVTARAGQLTVYGATSSEAVWPANLKFCVDSEYLEFAIALGFIEADDYDSLTDSVLRVHLEGKAKESVDSVTLEALDDIVERELKMDMNDKNARSPIETLFVSYHSILRRNGIAWLLDANQKVTVWHVLSAIRPKTLKDRLEPDLEFTHHKLEKDFKKFMAHTIKVSEAFQILDSGPKKNRNNGHRSGNDQNHGSRNHKSSPSHGGLKHNTGSVNNNKRPTPDCPYGPCKNKGLRHLIKDCRDSSRMEKDQLYAALTAAKAKNGSSRSTRSRKAADKTSKNTDNGKEGTKSDGTAGHLTNKGKSVTFNAHTPSCSSTVSDGRSSHQTTGRCDGGSDAGIVSIRLAERAALQGIGKINAINPVRLNVALKSGEEPQSFSFSRSWTSPRTVLPPSSGQLSLSNVIFLVADDDLACEDLTIGLPVLQLLQVDTRTLLENNRAALDGVNCTDVGNQTIP